MTKNTLDRCAQPTGDQCTTNQPREVAPIGDVVGGRVASPRTVVPRADLWETADAAHLAIELPGVTSDGLTLRVERDHLIVTAERDVAEPEGRALRVEWRPTSFRRSFALTDDADRDAIDASLRHGLLQVTIPRRAEKRPRSIEVRVDTN